MSFDTATRMESPSEILVTMQRLLIICWITLMWQQYRVQLLAKAERAIVRLSYATVYDQIVEAMTRMRKAFAELKEK